MRQSSSAPSFTYGGFIFLFVIFLSGCTCKQDQVKAALEMTKNMSVEEKKAMLLNGAVAEMFLNKDAGDAGEIQTAEVL